MNETRFVTGPRLASTLGVSPEMVRLAASRLRIEPALVLNDVAHFGQSQAQRIEAAILAPNSPYANPLATRVQNLH